MSSEATPISPARFASALKDLPLSTLHLKAAELHNSIAHLDYSNEQLKPFADGTGPNSDGFEDPDCIDAIKENEIVIARMQERIALLRAEVEGRGSSWLEFQTAEELEGKFGREALVNGTGEGHADEGRDGERSNPWTDGTFQPGRIVNGEVRMDGVNGVNGSANSNSNETTNTGANGSGGRLDDEALRRAMDERMRALTAEGGEEEDGMHL